MRTLEALDDKGTPQKETRYQKLCAAETLPFYPHTFSHYTVNSAVVQWPRFVETPRFFKSQSTLTTESLLLHLARFLVTQKSIICVRLPLISYYSHDYMRIKIVSE